MSFDLAELKFQVDTKRLEDAVKRLEEIREGVAELTKPLEDLGKAGSAASKGLDKLGKSKPAEPLEKIKPAADEAGKGLSALEKLMQKQALVLQVLQGSQISLADGQVQLDKVFTKGQASLLATASLLGATNVEMESLGNTFKNLNAQMGVNPFDKSAGGLNSLRKETQELAEVNNLLAQGFNLTRQEVQGLARDIVSHRAVAKADQLSMEELNKAIENTTRDTVELSRAKAALVASAKKSEEQQKKEAEVIAEAARAQALAKQQLYEVTEKTTALLKANAWKEYGDSLNTQSKAVSDLGDYYKQLEKEALNLASAKQVLFDKTEKTTTLLKANAWKEYNDSLNSQSKSITDLGNHYRQLEKEALDLAKAKQVLFEKTEQSTRAMKAEAWKEFGSNVGVRSKEISDLASYYESEQTLAVENNKAAANLIYNRHKWEAAFKEEQSRAEYNSLVADYKKLETATAQGEAELARLRETRENQTMKVGYVTQGYSLSAAAVGVKLKNSGADDTTIAAILDQVKAEEKLIKSAREATKATEYLKQVEESLNEQIKETNAELDPRHTDRLLKIQRAIQASGMAAEDAAPLMQRLDEKVRQVASKENEARLRNLSRAVSTQIGDVAISLASGMNPFTILLQQGDQMRFALLQSGATAEEVKTTMGRAFTDITKSVKDTGVMIGSFLVGSLDKAGLAMVNLIPRADLLKKTLRDIEVATAIGSSQGGILGGLNSGLSNLIKYIPRVLGGVIGLGAALIGTLAVAYFKVSAEEDKFTKAMVLNSGALGINRDAAYTQAKALGDLYGSTSKVIEVITEMGKAGNLTSNQIGMITKSAIELEKWGGVAIKDTVKQFSDLKSKSTEALAEISKSTGGVRSLVLEQVAQYELRGEKAKAAALASTEAERINEESVAKLKDQYNALGKTAIWVSEKFTQMWNVITGVSRTRTREEELQDAIDNNSAAIFGNDDQAKHYRTELQALRRSRTEQERLAQEQRQYNAEVKVASTEFIGNLTKEEEYNFKVNRLIERRNSLLANRETYKNASLMGVDVSELLVIKNIDNALKRLAEERAKSNTGTDEAAQLEKYYQSILNQGRDLIAKYSGKVENLTDSLIALAKVENDPLFNKLSPRLQEEIRLLFDKASALEKTAAAFAKAEAYGAKLEEMYSKSLEVQRSLDEESQKLTDTITAEGVALQYSLNTLGQKEEVTKKYSKELQARVTLEKELQKIEQNAREDKYVSPKAKQSDIDAANARYQQTLLNINSEVALDAATKLVQEMQAIRQSLADAIYVGLTEGGKAAAKSIRKMLQDTLKKKITLQIDAVLQQALNGLLGGSGESAAGAIQNGNAYGNMLSNAGAAYSAYQTGGFSGLGAYAGLTQTTTGIGATSSAATNAALAESAAGSSAASTTSLSATGWGLVAAAIYLGVKKAEADYSQGFNRSSAKNTSADILGNRNLSTEVVLGGVLRGIGLNDKWASILSGETAFAKTFGRAAPRVEAAGIEGTFAGSDFSGGSYQQIYEKGGLFRKSKTTVNRAALAAADEQSLESAYQSTSKSVKDLAKTVGLSTSALDKLSVNFKVNLLGLSEEDALKAIETEFLRIADVMAASVLVTTQYTREGETQLQTLTRISNTLGGMNDLFEKFGWKLNDVSLAGYAAADSFVNLFGGLDAATTALNNYYSNFYSEEDQLSNITANLSETFKELGYSMPSSKDAFVQMVDAAKSLGNTEAVAELVQLAPMFNELMQAQAEILSERVSLENELLTMLGATDELRKRQLEGMSSTNKALQEQIWQLEDARKAQEKYNTAVSELNNTVDGLLKTLTDFLQGSSSTSDTFAKTMQKALTGDTDAISALPTAAQALIDSSREAASTAFEANLAKAQVMQQVQSVADALGDPASSLQQLMLEAILKVQENTRDTVSAFNSFASRVSTDLVTTVSVIAISNLPQELKVIAQATNGVLTRTVDFVLGSELTQDWKEQLLSDSATLTRTIQVIANDSVLSAAQKELLLNATSLASRYVGIQANFAENLTEAEKSLLVQATSSATRVIQQSVQTGAMSQTDYLILTQQNANVQKIVEGLVDVSNLSPDQLALINAVGTQTTSLQLSAEVAFGPNSSVVPLLEAIADNTYTSAVVDYTGNPNVPPPSDPRRSDPELPYVNEYATGGVFTNSVVKEATSFHNSVMGEAGPEAIMPLSRSADGSLGVRVSGSDNSELLQELRRLNAKVDMLEAAARSSAVANTKMAKVLERVTPDGESIQITTAS